MDPMARVRQGLGDEVWWERAMDRVEQRLVALEHAVAEDGQGMDRLLRLVGDSMPRAEVLADRSFVQQLAVRVQRLEGRAEPAAEVSDMQAEIDRLQGAVRVLSEQDRLHAAALADLRAKLQYSSGAENTRHARAGSVLQAALTSQRKDQELRALGQLSDQVEQLRVTAERAGAKCTQLSESVAACGRRLDSVESSVERKLAAGRREARTLGAQAQRELGDVAHTNRGHANRSESTLAAVNASIGLFEVGQAAAVSVAPGWKLESKAEAGAKSELEPRLAAAIRGTVESLEVEVTSQRKRLDTLSLDLVTHGRDVAASSRLISESARSIAARTCSEPAEAASMLRQSLTTLEARVSELEACSWTTHDTLPHYIEMQIEELHARAISTHELPILVKDLVFQEQANSSLAVGATQMSRLESNLSALVERAAAHSELRMNELARRVGAIEDQSQRVALRMDAADESARNSAAIPPAGAECDKCTACDELRMLQQDMWGKIEAAATASAGTVEELAQVQEAIAQLQSSEKTGHDLARSIESLELQCERSESAAAEVSALRREVDELRISISVEQQVRQQNAAVSAVVAAAAIPGVTQRMQSAEASLSAQPPPSDTPLPVRTMSHQQIREQLRKYREYQQKNAAVSDTGSSTRAVAHSPALSAELITTAGIPTPEPELDPGPELAPQHQFQQRSEHHF